MNTTLTTDQAVTLAMVIGIIFGGIVALIAARATIKKYLAVNWVRRTAHEIAINNTMLNAYNAGYKEAKLEIEDDVRPSGNRGKK